MTMLVNMRVVGADAVALLLPPKPCNLNHQIISIFRFATVYEVCSNTYDLIEKSKKQRRVDVSLVVCWGRYNVHQRSWIMI